MGGSFDPIHFGHIKPALELARVYQLEKIILLPCKVSPFKDCTYASASHRWNMVNLVAANNELFVADGRELDRDAPSYSYTTLAELSEEIGAHYKLLWILGADALQDFPAWHRAEEIMQLAHILVMGRPGFEAPQSQATRDWLDNYLCTDIDALEERDFGHIFQTETEMLDISSSQIRAVIGNGEQPKYLLPGGVWNYIRRNQLYMDH